MTTKIVIVVSGGNIQDCYSNDEAVEIEVIDFDNIADAGKEGILRAEARLVQATLESHHIY
jgi:hypothetical protein